MTHFPMPNVEPTRCCRWCFTLYADTDKTWEEQRDALHAVRDGLYDLMETKVINFVKVSVDMVYVLDIRGRFCMTGYMELHKPATYTEVQAMFPCPPRVHVTPAQYNRQENVEYINRHSHDMRDREYNTASQAADAARQGTVYDRIRFRRDFPAFSSLSHEMLYA